MDEEKDNKIKDNDDSQPEQPESSSHSTLSSLANTSYFAIDRKKSKKNLYLVILGVIFLTVVGTFVINKNITKQEKSEATPAPTPTPTEAPKPIFNKADWTLEVQNGSGVTGAAKEIAAKLQELGYQIVKTGNADKDSYEKTQILVRSDLKEKIDLLIADLKDVIKIASVGGELNDSTASARIILGKE